VGENATLKSIRGSNLGDTRKIFHVKFWDEFGIDSPPFVLGTGMNGNVYRIFLKRAPEMQYALKMLPTGSAFTYREIKYYLEIDHPNIARIYEVYQSEDDMQSKRLDQSNSSCQLYLVTELCLGGDLHGYLKREKKLNEIISASLTLQILRAVNYLNSINIVHGDIKLENFVFAKARVVKLIDFGFAFRPHNDDSGIRSRRAIFGSPLYTSPESAMGNPSIKSDVWSVGVMVYMMLIGKSPFVGKNFAQIFDNINQVRDSIISAARGKVSKVAWEFISSCLEIDPSKRISAHDALNHKWLRGFGSTNSIVESNLQLCRDSIIQFSTYGPLKRASIGLVALHASPVPSLIGDLERIFYAIDSGGNGYITESELGEFIGGGRSGGGIDDGLFSRLDLLCDGRMNYSEFFAATEVNLALQMKHKSETYMALIETVFGKFDTDNSGFISFENLLSLFGRKGYQGNLVDDMIREGDYFGDGVVSLEEFQILLLSPVSATGISSPPFGAVDRFLGTEADVEEFVL